MNKQVLIAAGFVILAVVVVGVSIYAKYANYQECRERQYTVRYCLTAGR